MYEPPPPAASANIATCAASTASPPQAERKTAFPDSQATRNAAGTSTLASWRTTAGRVDAAEARDEREERVPEREGVAGVEAAVAELVHGAQREAAEVVELPHAGEVEEVVPTAQVPGEKPERDPEPDPGCRDEKPL